LTFTAQIPYNVQRIFLKRDSRTAYSSGRRAVAKNETHCGRYARSRIPVDGKTSDMAFDATLRAAAPYQLSRNRSGLAVSIKPNDIREKVREKKTGSTIVFIVDSSGSMGANQRMIAAKEAILSLLLDAYQKRDRIAMVAFRGSEAQVLLPPTDSVELGKKCLETLPTGGKTPLSDGLLKGYILLTHELRMNDKTRALIVVVSDGRANVSITHGVNAFNEALTICDEIHTAGIQSVIVDTEAGLIRIGKMREISDRLHGKYYPMDHIRAETVASIVRSSLE